MKGWGPPLQRWREWGGGWLAVWWSGPGAAGVDVAVLGAGADLDRFLGLLRALGRGESVAHLARAGADVEPGGRALADADVDGAVVGLQLDGAAGHFAHPQGAVRGGGGDRVLGPPDLDVAVGAAHPQLAGRGVDRRGAVGVLQDGGAVEEADAQTAGAGGDLGPALDPGH